MCQAIVNLAGDGDGGDLCAAPRADALAERAQRPAGRRCRPRRLDEDVTGARITALGNAPMTGGVAGGLAQSLGSGPRSATGWRGVAKRRRGPAPPTSDAALMMSIPGIVISRCASRDPRTN